MVRSAAVLSTPTVLVALLALLLLFMPRMEGMPMSLSPRPLCISQFALANHACSMLPIEPLLPSPPAPPSYDDDNNDNDDDDNDDDDDDDDGDDHDRDGDDSGGDDSGRGGGDGSSIGTGDHGGSGGGGDSGGSGGGHDGNGGNSGQGHGNSDDGVSTHGQHRRRHRRRHTRHDGQTPIQENCCRWLKEVDTECVCELLIRLPLFMAKTQHDFTINVQDSCSVTYHCGGWLKG